MAVDALVRQLGDAWGWILLRGLASIAFGALAVLWPGMTIVVLVIMWGAWAFVDHYGPDDVSAGAGMQVAPHPHTGLQTVSWLLEGAVQPDGIGGVAARISEIG